MVYKISFQTTRFIILIFCLSFSVLIVAGQQVRLRSQITPQCSPIITGSTLRYADVYADGNIAVQGSYHCRGAFIYDISDPDAPVLASYYTTSPSQQFLEAIVIGDRGYFGSGLGNAGVHILDLTDPYSPVLLGVVDPTHGNGHASIHEMVVFVQEGRTYLVENFNSSSFDKRIKVIDVTDPAAPMFKWEFTVAGNAWVHAMHVRGNRMFLSEFTGANISVYDISTLASQAPAFIGAVTANTTNHSSWTSEDGNYLYSARETFDGDLRVYDISDLQTPILRKTIKAADLKINAITPHNPVVKGNRLYVSWYQAGVQIFDISDPTDPVRIGQYDTFPAMFDTELAAEQSLRDEPWDLVCGAENLQNSLPTNFDGNWTVYPFLGDDKLIAGDLTHGLLILDASGLNAPPKNLVSDFDGDRKTDLSVFDPTSGTWTIAASSGGSQFPVFWGLPGDIHVAADYDGDGSSNFAVWRPSTGKWHIVYGNGTLGEIHWGLSGDVPVPGDFDADGRADLAVWRPSEGTWYIVQSTLGIRIQQWGLNGDKAVVGDYDGDGKTDLTVWRPSDGTWYVTFSSSSQILTQPWGLTGDIPVVTDLNGIGRDEFTVFRPTEGRWYRVDPLTGAMSIETFGLSGDVPIPADYDGDSKSDLAVFRPSNNTWYFVYSSDFGFRFTQFGQGPDVPSPSSAQPQ